jgi:signal transduction histidine kinase
MLRSLPFGRTVVVLLSLGFLALLGIGAVSIWLGAQVRDAAGRVSTSDLVRGEALRVYIAVREAEAGQRGYLITDDLQYLQPYQQGRTNAPSALNKLEELTAGDAEQQRSIAEIRPLVEQRFAIMQRTIDLARGGRKTRAVEVVRSGEGRNLTFEIGQRLGVMIGRETAALVGQGARSAQISQWLLIANLIAVALIVALAVMSLAMVGGALRELRAASRELRRVNEGLEQEVEERTQEIRRANEEIQRFAYIVSHDLRSPLVNVMGFTSELEAGGEAIRRQLAVVRERAPELLDPDAVLAAEEDLPESVGFIRTSTAKMDRLIAAILRLSRDGRRVLTPVPIAMTPMLEQVAASLTVMAEQAGAEIVVEPLPDLVSDRLAVEQVFSNLLENAVKYLQPGRPGRIVVSGRRRGSMCVYEVRDNGRGIAPHDRERVFELFRRAGAQDKPGEGLGLAFVQTNVRRLGGTIALTSELGQGSTFTLTFPSVLKLTPESGGGDDA